MAHRRRGERMVLNAEINVVSLIDVMMLLMVIFMITAPMMTGGVDVALPSAQATPLEANKAMTVTVTKAGEIFVDETRLTFDEFSGAFKALAARHGDGGAYLRADAGASYGAVVRVLAVMRASGVPNVGLVVEPEATP